MTKISNFDPTVLCIILLMGFLVIILPRKLAPVPIILAALYLTVGQRVVFFDLFYFDMLRILMLFGFARIIFREGLSSISLNPIDKTVIWWLAVTIVTYTLLYQTTGSLINRLGIAYDVIGSYFLFRFLIYDTDDINRLYKIIAISIAPLALIMLLEYKTGRNIFAVFGGVPTFSEIRDGITRAQGPFRHPILAGTLGATLVPLFVSLWWQNRGGKIFACMGIIFGMIIVIASHSSGPMIAFLAAVTALSMWPLRDNMRVVRWGILIFLVALHIYMKAPVYYIISRVSDLIGGSGWHRSYLIEQAIAHFNEWWLIGTKYTVHWIAYGMPVNPDSTDITNQFIGEGVNGGLAKMILFILILVRCFQSLGNRLHSTNDPELPTKITLWALGSALVTHIASFFSVSYFDQISLFYYLLLACISTVSIFPKGMELIKKKEEMSMTGSIRSSK